MRPVLGPSPHDVVWRDADSARVRGVLQNPAYAGAYVYGRRQKDASQCRRGSVGGTVKVAIADWAVCLKAAHPGYIGWEEFMANQRRMADNVNRYEAGHAGVPRKGSALLQGIAICGRCGRRMSLRYTGPNGDYPVYCCRFDRDQRGGALYQEVRAPCRLIDALVERLPARCPRPGSNRHRVDRRDGAAGGGEPGSWSGNGLFAASAPATRLSGRDASMTPLSLEIVSSRARSSEPGKRSCAPSRLSSRSMRAGVRKNHSATVWQTAQSYRPWVRTCRGSGTPSPRRQPTASAFCALLCKKSCSIKRRAQGQVWLKIVWQTGATSEHCLQRRVHTYRDYIDLERLRRRITELNNAGKMDKEIAASLNQRRLRRRPRLCLQGRKCLKLLRTRWKIPTTKINGASPNPMRWPDGTFSIQGVAVELGITSQTVFDYLKATRPRVRQPPLRSRNPFKAAVLRRNLNRCAT